MNSYEKIVPSSLPNSFRLCKIVGVVCLFFFFFDVYVLRTKISFLSLNEDDYWLIIKNKLIFYSDHLIFLNGCLLQHDLQISL